MTTIRGYCGDEVKATWAEHFPEDQEGLTTKKLRLLPYLMVKAMDHDYLQPAHIDQVEREIIADWRNQGLIYGGASDKIAMSDRFYNATVAVLRLSYANLPVD